MVTCQWKGATQERISLMTVSAKNATGSKTEQPTIKLIACDNQHGIPLASIEFADRDDPDSIFFNPRSADSEAFSEESMQELEDSIRLDGLIETPTVRTQTHNGEPYPKGNVVKVQAVAGERRIRCIKRLVEKKKSCYDQKTGKMMPAEKLYKFLPCTVYHNIDDDTALRLAVTENDPSKRRPLSTREEIDLVERLLGKGLSQDRVVKVLSSNPTWVCQTANFRKELPPKAFQALISGRLARNVAVIILSYPPEKREAVFERSTEIARFDTEAKVEELEDAQFGAEDTALLESERAKLALSDGDVTAAEQHKRRSERAEDKAKKMEGKKRTVVAEAGRVRQGHISKASAEMGVRPSRAKHLGDDVARQFYYDLPGTWLQMGNKADPITKNVYPAPILRLTRRLSDGMLKGECDLGRILRDHLVETGEWKLPEGYVEADA
jgi:ParB-like chromosome segregation protein Spo0J